MTTDGCAASQFCSSPVPAFWTPIFTRPGRQLTRENKLLEDDAKQLPASAEAVAAERKDEARGAAMSIGALVGAD